MMGPRQVEQGALFYNFSIDGHVPADHLLRSIDRFIVHYVRIGKANAGAPMQRSNAMLAHRGPVQWRIRPRLRSPLSQLEM